MSQTKAQLISPVGIVTASGINVSGVVTATSFSGDGSGLTGVGIGTDGSVNTVGIITASSFSGDVVIGAGSTSAPSLAPTGDSNTGVFFPSADTIALSSGGSERIRVDSSGNINIDSGGVYYDAANNRLAVGTASPGSTLDVAGVVTTSKGYTFSAASTAADTYLGTFAPGGNALAFTTLGSERARIDSSGRLLVGTSTARDKFFNSTYAPALQIEGTTYSTSMSSIVANGTGIEPYLILGRSRGTAVGGTTIVNNGDKCGVVSFQGSDGTEMMSMAEIFAQVDGTPGANDMPGRIVLATTADGGTSPTERMSITSGGTIAIPAATSAQIFGTPRLAVNGDDTSAAACYFRQASNSTRTHIDFRNGNGVVGSITTSGSSTSYNTSSDYRLKENVIPATGAIGRLQQLPVYRFNFIADPNKTVDGFLAHEAQAVVPECATGEKDAVDADGNPIYQGIDQSKLVPLLTAALQEAIGEIESLKARVAALESA